jgi:hypothetical protein
MFDRRPSNNNYYPYITVNAANTLSHSSDSHAKILKNSLKNRVNIHSENEIELNL